MSAPSIDLASPTTWVPLAVFAASLLGSAHCVGMCGGLALSVGKNASKSGLYHLGRLTGYLWLGLLAGTLGAATMGNGAFGAISWISTLLLATGFIAMGISLWRGRGAHLFSVPQKWITSLHKTAGGHPFAVGGLSALLPCGWLHTFVLGSVATQSPLKGALILFLFWLGTVPALSATSWLTQSVLKPVSRRIPRVSALLLIMAGLTSVGIRARPLMIGAIEAQLHSGAAAMVVGGEDPAHMTCHHSH